MNRGYLVLTRRVGERIFLETPTGEIELIVGDLDLATGQVKLGFKADQNVTILREEVRARPINMSDDWLFVVIKIHLKTS